MSRTIALLIVLMAAMPAAAAAQSDGTPGGGSPPADAPSATERLQEGAVAIVEGLRMLMDQLQGYQPPEVLPNGDIIIRRRPPEEDRKPTPDDDAPKGDAPKGDDSLKL